jgi:hypothetical protein
MDDGGRLSLFEVTDLLESLERDSLRQFPSSCLEVDSPRSP